MRALEQVLDGVAELADPGRTVSDLPGGLTNANYKVVTGAGASDAPSVTNSGA